MLKIFGQVKKNIITESKNIRWTSPIGLAAGFDKDAKCLNYLSKVGFGSVEIGTITLEPQLGNPKPRIWRYPNFFALRNKMGFPSIGSHLVLENLKKYKGTTPIGINIGKNKDTPNDKAYLEYIKLYEMLAPYGQYIVINISSPNTPGLRDLQDDEQLKFLFQKMQEVRNKLPKPLYLKISPDLHLEQVKNIYNICQEFKLAGIIATNTTIQHSYGAGGVSGSPLYQYSSKICAYLLDLNKGYNDFDIICCGGISSIDQINELKKLGAKFFQIYTAFVYHGPKKLIELNQFY